MAVKKTILICFELGNNQPWVGSPCHIARLRVEVKCEERASEDGDNVKRKMSPKFVSMKMIIKISLMIIILISMVIFIIILILAVLVPDLNHPVGGWAERDVFAKTLSYIFLNQVLNLYDIQVCCYSDFLKPDEDTGLEGIPLETVHWAVMSLVYLIIFFRTCSPCLWLCM